MLDLKFASARVIPLSELQIQKHARLKELASVLFESEVRQRPPKEGANFGFGTLAAAAERLRTFFALSSPQKSNAYAWPDAHGRFGAYGGTYVAETLMPLVLELERAYAAAKADPAFQAELDSFLTHYVGRPSPLYFAERLTEHAGGAG